MIDRKWRRAKRVKPSDELPSFLASIRRKTKEIQLTARKNDFGFQGPIFFGGCEQHHPKSHPIYPPSLSVDSYRARASSAEDIWKDLLREVPTTAKNFPPQKPFRLVKDKRLTSPEERRRPRGGNLVVAGREAVVFAPRLCKRRLKIRGDTIREILCSIPVEETIRWEDVAFEQERKRNLMEVDREWMPTNQRRAHYHFPKEFITVRVMGPLVPQSLTVTALPIREEDVATRNRAVQVHEESLLEEEEVREFEEHGEHAWDTELWSGGEDACREGDDTEEEEVYAGEGGGESNLFDTATEDEDDDDDDDD